jgi:hypothetical protein
MESTRVRRAAGAAGVLSTVLILGALYLVNAGIPGASADAEAWAAWARRNESALETAVYFLLVPGLLLFLWMFAALVGLLPPDTISARLASYGALAFFVFFAAAGVLWSTTASTFGFFRAFEDPTAVTVFTELSAGYHLQAVGIWSLAMTMLATAIGLRSSGVITSPLYVASLALVVAAVFATLIGFGVIPCLVWIVAASLGLLRTTTPPSDRVAEATST